MSLHHSPRIVTSGLVLDLDAANTKSYPGSGTTWLDISGNLKNAAFNGTPVFTSSAAQSYFSGFTSSTNFLEVTNSYSSPSIPTGTNDRTIMAFIKTPSSISGYQHILHYGADTSDQSFGLAIQSSSFNNHTWNGNSNASSFTVLPSTNYCIAVRFSNTQSPRNNFFINGLFPQTGFGQGKTVDYAINTGTSNTLKIGMRISSPTEGFSPNGIIYRAMIYNRVLTDVELNQNYNALRGRYGL